MLFLAGSKGEVVMFDLLFGLVVGSALGYAIRSYMSYRRHSGRRRKPSVA